MNIGLTKEQIDKIYTVFELHPSIEKVIILGSRAIGNYKPASDIDLSLVGDNLDLIELNEIENQLDDLYLPYKFDISIFNKISSPKFLEHIKRAGKIFYSNNNTNPIKNK